MSDVQAGGVPENTGPAIRDGKQEGGGGGLGGELKLSRRAVGWTFALLLVAMTVAAYWPMTKAGFIWDDDDYVQTNAALSSPTALSDIWVHDLREYFKIPPGAVNGKWADPLYLPQYYPLVFTSFWVEKQLWGLNATGYHVVNILLHAGTALLLWRVLKYLRVPGAMLAAALFAVHPMMAETVAWVTERKNTLSAFLMLASLLAYLHFGFKKGKKARFTPEEWGFYGLSVLLYVLALTAKTMAVGLAPLLVLLIWWKRPAKPWVQLVLTAPYFVLGFLYGQVTRTLEVVHVGAYGPEWDLSPVQRVLLAGRDVWFYVYKLLVPVNLSLFYDRWVIDPGAWWQWIFPVAAVVAFVVLLVLIPKTGKGLVVAAVGFAALVFPALGFFPIYPFTFAWVADHFVYHASLAFFAAMAAVLTLAARLFMPGMKDYRLAAAVVAVVVLGCMTYVGTQRFMSYETLWPSVIVYNPEHPNFNALSGMSGVYSHQAMEAKQAGRIDEANALMGEAKKFDERALATRPGYALSYANFAAYDLFMGEPQKAIEPAMKAIELAPTDPRLHVMLGRIYATLHQNDKALEAYLKAVHIRPRMADYHVLCARVLMELGEEKRAKLYIANALYLQPNMAEGHLLRGYMLASSGQVEEGLRELRRAAALNPDNLEALEAAAKAIAVNPTSTRTDLDEGFAYIKRALEKTNGTNPAYLDTLGMLLVRAGRVEEALEIWRSAWMQLKPEDTVVRESIRRHVMPYVKPGTSPATGPETLPG